MSVCFLLFLLILPCCGREGGEGKAAPAEPGLPEYSEPLEVTGFTLMESPPETVSVRWSGEGSGTVRSVAVRFGDGVLPGDTLLLIAKDIDAVLKERLRMELEVAVARLSSSMPVDSLLNLRVDSLSGLLDSLEKHDAVPLLSPLEGTVLRILSGEGDRTAPGNALIELSVASSTLFLVHPPDGCSITSWPSGGDSVRLVEEHAGHAVYSGHQLQLEELFSRLEAVERAAVFESDLNSYVITPEYDTISVLRMGEAGNSMVLVLPSKPLPGQLVTWAGKSNGE